MPGLFDSLMSPENRLGLAMLAASGPSAQPMSLGQRMAQALGQVQAQGDNDLKSKLIQAQTDDALSQSEQRKAAVQQQKDLAKFWESIGQRGQSGTAGLPQAFVPGGMTGDASTDAAIGGGAPAMPAAGPMPSAAPGGVAGNNPLMGMNLQDVAMLKARFGKDLLPEWKAANEPLELKPGSTYVDRLTGRRETVPTFDKGQWFNPATQRVEALPGFDQASAGTAAAVANVQQEAQARYTPRDIVTPGGRAGTISNLTALGGAQAPGGAPMPMAAPMGRPAPFQAPAAPMQGVRPGYESAQAAQGAASGNVAEQINMRLAEMQRTTDPLLKQSLQREIARLGALAQPEGGAAPVAPPMQAAPAPSGLPAGAMEVQSPAQKEFNAKAAGMAVTTLETGQQKAQAAADSLDTIAETRKAIAGGAYQGMGADMKLNVAKFGQALGFSIDPEKVANTDYLKSTLGKGLLDQAKTLGTNPSNADATRINEIVGSIGKDPRAMNKILDWQEAMALKSIGGHNKRVDDIESRNGPQSMNFRVDMPKGAPVAAAPASAPAAPGSAAKVLDALPTANASNAGRTATDTATGQKYRSNGLQWVKVQ